MVRANGIYERKGHGVTLLLPLASRLLFASRLMPTGVTRGVTLYTALYTKVAPGHGTLRAYSGTRVRHVPDIPTVLPAPGAGTRLASLLRFTRSKPKGR
jgi:hypothetical protein